MHSMDYAVLHKAQDWLASGQPVWLATVVRTWGSAPRPVGSLMAVRGDGQVVGSVSGGCVEDHLVAQLRNRELAPELPVVLRYGAQGDESRRFDLPCGATLAIVLERLSPQSGLREILEVISRREVVGRELDMQTGVSRVLRANEARGLSFDERILRVEFGPRYRLLLIGAGQVTQYLAQMAMSLDYQVSVCEPREEYREAWEIASIPLSHEMPDDWILQHDVDGNTAIVALSHDPKLDDMGLLEALVSPAFYVGAIGSRRNSAARKQRMMQHFDLTRTQVERLHGPVGLYIGAATPPEIAVSILAEMTAVRRGVAVSQGSWRTAESVETTLQSPGTEVPACFRVS